MDRRTDQAGLSLSKKPPLIDIVIPVYNEHGCIEATLDQIASLILTPSRVNIIYDHPDDTTLPAVHSYKEAHPEASIRLIMNKMPGALNAIKTGFSSSECDAVLVVMADTSDDLRAVDAMYQKIQEGAAVVCGSRYMKGGQQIGGPLLKKTLSRLAGVSLHHLTGLPTKDATNSFKMYRSSFINSIQIESTGGFEIGLEIVVKAHLKKHWVAEIPTIWHDRVAGESRFLLFRWLPKYLYWYLKALKIPLLP